MWAYFIVPTVGVIMGLVAMFNDYSHGSGKADAGELYASI
jgi:hypothetical protein